MEQNKITHKGAPAVEPRPHGHRDYRMDNLKGLLIFAVVLGHMLELFKGNDPNMKLLYLVIYSFHMPLFAFVTGVFARYQPDRIRKNMIYPYLVFQTLYLLFENQVMEKEAQMQYTTPYWLLWYLFAIIVWNLVLPLVQGKEFSGKKKLLILLAAFAAAVLIGFDDKAGYYLSFSRIVEFFPYFLMGVYFRGWKETFRQKRTALEPDGSADQAGQAEQAGRFGRYGRLCRLGLFCRHNLLWRHGLAVKGAAVFALLFLLAGIIALLADNVEEIRTAWFYGSLSYERGDYTWRFRIFGMGAAFVWLAFFLLTMPARRLPFLSYIGANTMPVYLLHGFIIKFLSKIHLFRYIENDVPAALLLSLLLVMLLSWKPLVSFLAPLFRWERREKKRRGQTRKTLVKV